MGDVVQPAQFVLDHVAGKIAAVVAAAGQVVVRQRAGPHHLGAGVVILRITVQDVRVPHHGAEQPLRISPAWRTNKEIMLKTLVSDCRQP